MSITVTPTDATLGAVITDVDLAQLDDATWEEIHAAFLTYGVLIFPGQNLTEEAQGAFALRFGNIEKLAPKQDKPTIQFSNQKPDGTTAQPSDPGYPLMRGNEGWHTDSTYMPLAAKAAMLMALVVPPEGGETEFADMRAAYDALSPQMQEKLEGLSAHHSLYHSQSKAGYIHKTDHLYGFHDKGAPRRPVIKTHPETGRKSIYTGRHAYGIVGMAPEESEALLDALMEDACQPAPNLSPFVAGRRPRGLGQPLPNASCPSLRHGPPARAARIEDCRRAGNGVGTGRTRTPAPRHTTPPRATNRRWRLRNEGPDAGDARVTRVSCALPCESGERSALLRWASPTGCRKQSLHLLRRPGDDRLLAAHDDGALHQLRVLLQEAPPLRPRVV